MLEQSKAKHDALVSQAQTQQAVASTQATSQLYGPSVDLNLDLASVDLEAAAAGRVLIPKPPVQPSYKRPINNTRTNRLVAILFTMQIT